MILCRGLVVRALVSHITNRLKGYLSMKFRNDFVTNSSSSSFICEICGEVQSGWDISYEEAGFVGCCNGHEFCEEHMLSPTKQEMIDIIIKYEYRDYEGTGELYTSEQLDQMSEDELIEIFMDERGDLPEIFCPICQFEEYSEEDMARYLECKYKVSRDEVFAEIKKQNKRRRKLYDSEYIAYVARKFDLNLGEIQAGWKEKFGTYSNFHQRLYN